MDSATNSRVPERRAGLRTLARRVGAAARTAPVPLLVLRLPQFERLAWREGRRAAHRLERATARAFADAARQLLRVGDAIAHDAGSDVFAIAMTSPSRAARLPSPTDCRAVLERVAAAISSHTNLRVECGWTPVACCRGAADLEREIDRALERGRRERERYEFFAVVGHELRTPLTSIRGYLETLLESGIDSVTAAGFLETARREALRMGRLLDGMFEFSLLDLSVDAIPPHGCDVAAQIFSACDVVRPLAAQRGIRVATAIEKKRKAALDPDAALQLLINLLENAVKYGRDGGEARVTLSGDGEHVVLSVDDDGPGIAREERESIFTLRVRGMQGGQRPGSGIGLAIAKTIVERAGGEIRVTDSPLGGARFEALLPCWAESGAPAS